MSHETSSEIFQDILYQYCYIVNDCRA